MKNIWAEIRDILAAPLTEKLDTVHLFLIVGLVIVFISAWLVLLKYMQAGISTVAEAV